MDADIYLALVTIHGTIMVFFVLTAGLSGTFSNLLIPLQIGARDMASGFLNMVSYWLFFLSSVFMVLSLFVEAGPAAAGWTIYPPLSALPLAQSGSGMGMTLWLVSMAIFIASSLLGSLNYIVTVINLRTKGMSMTRLPLTIWAFFITAIIGVVSFPVLLSAALLLIMDRSFGTSFFLSDIFIQGEVLHYQGGSPVLFEHLFWFLGHPEVYIVILPAMGLVSEIMATNSRKPIFGYRAMIASILAIAFLSTIVWGHHMFVSGMNPFLGSVFTFTTLQITFFDERFQIGCELLALLPLCAGVVEQLPDLPKRRHLSEIVLGNGHRQRQELLLANLHLFLLGNSLPLRQWGAYPRRSHGV